MIVLATFPAEYDCAALARRLVGKGLAASVNMMRISSTYYWRGEVVESGETLMILKTERGAYERLKQEIIREHPYEVPFIAALQPLDAHTPYLEWVLESTTRRL